MSGEQHPFLQGKALARWSMHLKRTGRVGYEPPGQSANGQVPTHALVGRRCTSVAAGSLCSARLPPRGVLSRVGSEVSPDAVGRTTLCYVTNVPRFVPRPDTDPALKLFQQRGKRVPPISPSAIVRMAPDNRNNPIFRFPGSTRPHKSNRVGPTDRRFHLDFRFSAGLPP